MSIWDMFKATPPAGAIANPTVPTPPTPGAPVAPTPGGQPSSMVTPPTGEEAPLSGYAGMWNAENKGTDPTFSANLSFDPTKVSQAATKLDFKQMIDPALAAKALGGDPASLIELLNQTSQATFAKAVQASGMMTQEASKRQSDAITGSLPEFLRRQQASVAGDNKFFANPAVSPIIDTIQRQLAITYPNATPAELKQHAISYFDGMAKEYTANTPASTAAAAVKKAGEENWGDFFGVPAA